MLQLNIVLDGEFAAHLGDHARVGFEVALDVETVLLLGVIHMRELFATQTVDLLQLGAFCFEFGGDDADESVNAFFVALKVQDVDALVFSIHDSWVGF